MLALVLALGLAACTGSRPYSLAPIKTVDPDRASIPKPEAQEEVFFWDSFHRSVLYQIEKPLNLNWTLRRLGQAAGLVGPREADNVNALDEVPNSSWYTNRHFHDPMSLKALRRGPDTSTGPDTTGPLTVIDAKREGRTRGFFVRDGRGDVYLLKLDAQGFPSGAAAEAITTKIYYAAGYHVPQNTVVYIDPARLVIGEEAEIEEAGGERKMMQEDIEEMLDLSITDEAGRFRALASKFVEGEPLGIWRFLGTREDDPNDRVRHEHRRELRGLGVLAAWLNDVDRRDGNTMATYVEEDGRRYVKHYLLDMGSTLGAAGTTLRETKRGHEYRFDPRTMVLSYVGLGTYVKPWEREAGKEIRHPSVGYFESEIFSPGAWFTSYPNPAFEKTTARDGYWGAKIVTSFTDDQIRALAETGELDEAAEAFLIHTLIARRDKIGRYWFSRINPLDRFEVAPAQVAAAGEAGSVAPSHYVLRFDDLAVQAGLSPTARYRYVIDLEEGPRIRTGTIGDTTVPLLTTAGDGLHALLAEQNRQREEERVFRITLEADRPGELSGRPVYVYLHYPAGSRTPRIAGIERTE